ncbi:MAG TPA: hypothetical protein VJK27_01065 [Terriglobales bacterium]|jgi:hypothetical protein|nr:hypothetical protein [Terriglobales bacterium]
MIFGSKIVRLVLIAALAIASLPSSGWAEVNPGATDGGRSTGCHLHGERSLPKRPSSPPGNNHCCLTGHDTAIVRAAFVTQPSAETLVVGTSAEPALAASGSCGLLLSIVVSSGSPGLTPLRV